MCKKIIGPLIVVILVFLFSYLSTHALTHLSTYAPKHLSTVFSISSILPKTPQDYILLGQKININTATKEILDALPGIGPSTAERIIKYRTSHGPFKSTADLESVKGIGPKTVENLKPYLEIAF